MSYKISHIIFIDRGTPHNPNRNGFQSLIQPTGQDVEVGQPVERIN